MLKMIDTIWVVIDQIIINQVPHCDTYSMIYTASNSDPIMEGVRAFETWVG